MEISSAVSRFLSPLRTWTAVVTWMRTCWVPQEVAVRGGLGKGC